MRALASVIASAIALALPACTHAQPTESAQQAVSQEPWRAVDAETGKIRDVEGLEELARDFPDSGNVRLRLLQPYLAAGEMEKVMETLEWLYDRGYVFSEVAQTQIPKLMEGVDPGRIAERLRAEAEVIGSSEVIATVPADAKLVESALKLDGMSGVLVTSVNQGQVFTTGREGQWLGSNPENVVNLSGIAGAQEQGHYWVAAGVIDGREASAEDFAGLIKLGVPAVEKERISAPQGVSLSDLTRGFDGTLFASDPLGGGVYRANRGATELEVLVAPGTLRSPQGLATSADNSKLYVSDYRYGIAIVDLATGGVSRLASDIPVILDGVDGLWRRGDELIVVQNGTSPMRIAAFKLSEDGNRVVGHRVIEQANPEWTEPLSGNLDGDALIYVGNGQWDRYVEGVPAHDKPPLPTQIRRLPLD